jgi:hypothetical protein
VRNCPGQVLLHLGGDGVVDATGVSALLSVGPQPNMDEQFSVTTTKRKTLYFLLGGLLLSIGTPTYLGLTRPDVGFYLLQPTIFAVQSLPYILTAGLWLPRGSRRASKIGQVLASLLFLVAVLLYIPMLTGLWPTGGDMVALGFFVIAIGTTSSILLVTLVAFCILWFSHRGS